LGGKVEGESEVEFREDFFDAFNYANLGANNLTGVSNVLNPEVFQNVQINSGWITASKAVILPSIHPFFS